MVVKIRFLGSLRSSVRKCEFELNLKEAITLKQVVDEIVEKSPKLKSVLIDIELNDPRPNVLILVNERDISVLKGLETNIVDGDEIVFIPVIHGG
jgi:molybdopterin synthase sulfur carrier subunit